MTTGSDEDLANVIEEQDEWSESLGSATCLHLFVLPMQPSLQPETTFETMSVTLIKINVKNDGKASNKG